MVFFKTSNYDAHLFFSKVLSTDSDSIDHEEIIFNRTVNLFLITWRVLKRAAIIKMSATEFIIDYLEKDTFVTSNFYLRY